MLILPLEKAFDHIDHIGHIAGIHVCGHALDGVGRVFIKPANFGLKVGNPGLQRFNGMLGLYYISHGYTFDA